MSPVTDPFSPTDPEVTAVHARHPKVPQDPLPAEGMPEPPPPRIQSKRESAPKSPRWSKYRPVKRVSCDDCAAALATSEGAAPMTRGARFQRSHEGERRLLCGSHAQDWRERDGLKPLLDRPDEASKVVKIARRRRA